MRPERQVQAFLYVNRQRLSAIKELGVRIQAGESVAQFCPFKVVHRAPMENRINETKAITLQSEIRKPMVTCDAHVLVRGSEVAGVASARASHSTLAPLRELTSTFTSRFYAL